MTKVWKCRFRYAQGSTGWGETGYFVFWHCEENQIATLRFAQGQAPVYDRLTMTNG